MNGSLPLPLVLLPSSLPDSSEPSSLQSGGGGCGGGGGVGRGGGEEEGGRHTNVAEAVHGPHSMSREVEAIGQDVQERWKVLDKLSLCLPMDAIGARGLSVHYR
jgi:hypothetical protein